MSPYREVKLIFKLRWELYTKEERSLAREIGLSENSWISKVVVEIDEYAELDKFIPKIKKRLEEDVLRGLPEEWKKFEVDADLISINLIVLRSEVISRESLISETKSND